MNTTENHKEGYLLIFYTGDGRNKNTTKIAWYVFEYKTNKKELHGYKNKSKIKIYLIVNAVTKYWRKNRYLPVFLAMNYKTLIDGSKEMNILLSHLIL